MSINQDFESYKEHWYNYKGNGKEVVFPEDAVRVGLSSFLDEEVKHNIVSVVVPEGVTRIDGGWFGFRACKNIQKLIIPDVVVDVVGEKELKSIFDFDVLGYKLLEGSGEFAPNFEKLLIGYIKSKKRRTSYIEVALKKDKHEIVASVLKCVGKMSIEEVKSWIVQAEQLNADKSKDVLMEYLEKAYSKEDVKNKEAETLAKKQGLKELTISDWRKIYKINTYTNDATLKEYRGSDVSVQVPKKVGKYVVDSLDETFHGCEFIEEINLQEGIKSIMQRTFMGCTRIKKIEIPKSVTMIGEKAFFNCCELHDIVFFTEELKFERGAFQNCTGIEELKLPQKMRIIANDMFRNCKQLKKIYVSENLFIIGSSAFRDCEKLEDIELPEGLSTIGEKAFMGCKELQSMRIPRSVDSIQGDSFKGCEKLILGVYKDSYAEEYAKQKKLDYLIVE